MAKSLTILQIARILHEHWCVPKEGKAMEDKELFSEILKAVKDEWDVMRMASLEDKNYEYAPFGVVAALVMFLIKKGVITEGMVKDGDQEA